MIKYRSWLTLIFALCLVCPIVKAQTNPRPIKIAVLDFGETITGKLTSEKVASTLRSIPSLSVVDRDLARAAARGAHYTGSLNLALAGARDLGAAIGCDFFVLGESQTVRRSPSTGPAYFESYAAAFLVSARSGKLIYWERPSVKDSTAAAAERLLLDLLGKDETRQRYLISLKKAQEDERLEREVTLSRDTPVIEESGDDSVNDKGNFRPPRPYRRLRPVYPESAAVADAEGTVDVLVELDQDGEVKQVEVARWAGFGLDEATVSTVRQLHFSPAIRDGIAIPIRVLLRYNFRQPPK